MSRIEEMHRLRVAAAPVAEWARAVLGTRTEERDDFLPDRAVIYSVGDVRLTVGHLRSLVRAMEASDEPA